VRRGDSVSEIEHPPKRPHDPARMDAASKKLHEQATAYMKAKNCTYTEAAAAVTSDPTNRALVTDWAGVV
jgi:hypothetical protein